MKKFTAIITAILMALSLAACSSGTSSESDDPAASDTASFTESGASSEPDISSEPETSEHEESTPETSAPETSTPETSTPETNTPETSAPETSTPQTSAPETSKPQTSVPETSAPQTGAPQTSKPSTSKPNTPQTTKPSTSKPETGVPDTSSEPEVPEIDEGDFIPDAVTLLNSTWALFGEDEQFPVAGGDFSSEELIQGAGSFSLENPDSLDYVAGFPAAEIGKIDSAATIMHMMNQNTFSGAAFHVVDGADMAELSKAVRDNIMNRQWMCGFPDKLIVANVGEYLVCAFGKNQPIDAFSAHLIEAFPFADIVVEEPIL